MKGQGQVMNYFINQWKGVENPIDCTSVNGALKGPNIYCFFLSLTWIHWYHISLSTNFSYFSQNLLPQTTHISKLNHECIIPG